MIIISSEQIAPLPCLAFSIYRFRSYLHLKSATHYPQLGHYALVPAEFELFTRPLLVSENLNLY